MANEFEFELNKLRLFAWIRALDVDLFVTRSHVFLLAKRPREIRPRDNNANMPGSGTSDTSDLAPMVRFSGSVVISPLVKMKKGVRF